MDKTKVIMIAFALLTFLLLFFGMKKIKSIQGQINEKKENLKKLDERLTYVKNLEESLELRRIEGQVLRQIPRVKDPIANQVLMKKFFESFLSRIKLEAEVKVENERASKDFPTIIGANEVPLMIGIKDYTSYTQIMNMFEEFKNYPFGIEMFTIGGTSIPVPGHIRLLIKYYIIPEVT
jgi:hypothetical protein